MHAPLPLFASVFRFRYPLSSRHKLDAKYYVPRVVFKDFLSFSQGLVLFPVLSPTSVFSVNLSLADPSRPCSMPMRDEGESFQVGINAIQMGGVLFFMPLVFISTTSTRCLTTPNSISPPPSGLPSMPRWPQFSFLSGYTEAVLAQVENCFLNAQPFDTPHSRERPPLFLP